MDATIYAKLRTYTALKGAWVGLVWIVSFACFIAGLARPGFSLICILTGIASVFVAGRLVKNFRRQTADIGFGMAWWMSWMMFIYASLLMAAAQYVYFRYMDNGFVPDTYAALMQQPEVEKALQNMGNGQNYRELVEQTILTWRTTSPIELTIEFLISNTFLGTLLSIPVAAIGCMGKVAGTNCLKQ